MLTGSRACPSRTTRRCCQSRTRIRTLTARTETEDFLRTADCRMLAALSLQLLVAWRESFPLEPSTFAHRTDSNETSKLQTTSNSASLWAHSTSVYRTGFFATLRPLCLESMALKASLLPRCPCIDEFQSLIVGSFFPDFERLWRQTAQRLVLIKRSARAVLARTLFV